MADWVFRDYLDQGGTNVIRAWLDSLPKAAKVKIDYRILLLRGISVWPPQYVSALKGCDDIYELRIGSSGVEYRPLGFYGPDRKEFTIVYGAIEKGGKLPKESYKTAKERAKVVISDRCRSCEHEFCP